MEIMCTEYKDIHSDEKAWIRLYKEKLHLRLIALFALKGLCAPISNSKSVNLDLVI